MSEGKIPTLRGGVSVALRVPRHASKVLRSVSRGVECASIDVGCASIDVSERDSIRCASEMRRDTVQATMAMCKFLVMMVSNSRKVSGVTPRLGGG